MEDFFYFPHKLPDGINKLAYLKADQSAPNSSFTDVPGMSFRVNANTSYKLHFFIYVSADKAMNVYINAPNGTLISGMEKHFSTGGNVLMNDWLLQSAPLSISTGAFAYIGEGDFMIITDSSPGIISLQNSIPSTGTYSTISAGSYMILEELKQTTN